MPRKKASSKRASIEAFPVSAQMSGTTVPEQSAGEVTLVPTVRAASLMDILGFNPRRGESRPPIPEKQITLSDHRVGELLALSGESVANLSREERAEFDQALLHVEARCLTKWQRALRDKISSSERQDLRYRVHRDNEAGSGLETVDGHRRMDNPGGSLAFA